MLNAGILGWYWQPAASAKKKLRKIEFEAMLK